LRGRDQGQGLGTSEQLDIAPLESYAEDMQIQLTPAQISFVDMGIQEGRFRGPEEAVQQALALWEKRERARVELLAFLDLADQELDAGGGETYTTETLRQLVASVEQRGKQTLAGQ
jgi:Arc/MetJ-type ribon-helix-helix transcriptional regulator